MKVFIRVSLVILLVVSMSGKLSAQYISGTTGLITTPTADMQDDGRFMGGFNYLPKEVLPSNWSYDTANYFLNITFLPFLEVAFVNTIVKLGGQYEGKVNQDRSLSGRIRLLRERKWIPAVVVGANDLFTTSTEQYNPFEDSDTNRGFASLYCVMTKNFNFNDHTIGASIGYNVSKYDYEDGDGVFGGVSYRPAFARELQFMADVSNGRVSLGAAVLFWKHLALDLFCYDFKALGAGIRYEITLY
ncbi:MAG: YjbH domain-containing protein [Rikenellaceae bacterium]